jgi:hypothetical protein
MKYSVDEMVSIFKNLQLPDQISDEFKTNFSEEILKNVFNDAKRTELCLHEADVLLENSSDRGLSMDD